MPESNLNEQLTANLRKKLKQINNDQNRLMERIREVEKEEKQLRDEMADLEKKATQVKELIHSMIETDETVKETTQPFYNSDPFDKYDDYNNFNDMRREEQYGRNNLMNRDNYNNMYQDYPRQNQNYQRNDYQNDTVAYFRSNQERKVPQIAHNIEPLNQRFADRTITQACTLLLREANTPLHVNELYNHLLAGGFQFKGNNPTISIAVSLNRNSRFTKVAPGTFDLKIRDASKAS